MPNDYEGKVKVNPDLIDDGVKVSVDDWWDKRIEVYEQFHEEEFVNKNKRFRDYYKGLFWRDKTNYDRMSVNYVFPTTNVLIGGNLNQNPQVNIHPEEEDFEEGAKFLNAVFPRILVKNKLRKHMRKVIFDAATVGWGCTKTMWDFEMNMPKTLHVSPFEVLVPPTIKGLDDINLIPVVIHRVEKSLREVRANKYYKNTSALKAEKRMKYRPYNTTNVEIDEDLVTLYEIHTRDDDRIITIAQRKLLRNIANPDDFGWGRFQFLAFYPVTDDVFPLAITQTYEPQQLEKNKVRTQMAQHREGNNSRWVADDKSIDRTNMTRFEANMPNSLFFIKGNPREKIMELPHANITTDAFQIDSVLDRDQQNITGIGDIKRGTIAKREQTATEAQLQEKNADITAQDIETTTSEYVSDILMLQTQLLQQHMTGKMQVRLHGVPGMQKFDKETIKGSYVCSVAVGSMKPPDTQKDIQNLVFLSDFLAKNAQFMQASPPNLKPIVEEVMEKMGFRHADKVFQQPQQVLPPQGEIPPPGLEHLANPKTGRMMPVLPPQGGLGGNGRQPEPKPQRAGA